MEIQIEVIINPILKHVKVHRKENKRGSSQKRESSNRRGNDYNQIASILQKEIGLDDYQNLIPLPIEAPYIENEEKRYISKLLDTHLTPRNESKFNLILIKSIARIRSLNKIWYILKNELALSNDKITTIVQKYHKAVEEGAESDRRLIAMQKEFSASKYNSNLNSTSLSYRNNELDGSNLLFNRKFSQTVDGKLSNTVINYNDSKAETSAIISPSKDYKTERKTNDYDLLKNNYSPNRDLKGYNTEHSQTRIPKQNNMFNTK